MHKHVLYSLIRNDLQRNKAIHATLFLFLFLSALLLATGIMVIDRLSGAIDQLYDIASPPHYLQMHVGDYDREAVQAFAKDTKMVKKTQFQEMLNIEGVNLTFHRQEGTMTNLSDSLLDNYFVTQNPFFDYLVDLNNDRILIQPGEVGIPVSYARERQLSVGDDLVVSLNGHKTTLKVIALIRDAQMGSSLASSIRFLINDADFSTLSPLTQRHEVLIEFRLHDPKDLNAFEALYNAADSNMPKNGVGITLPLITLVNGIGDGLMSGVIILVSVILMAIALLNIRFTLHSTLEDDVREIGTLKAIGLHRRDIRQLYHLKFSAMALFACTLAVLSATASANVFLQNIAMNFGLSDPTLKTYLLPVLAVLVLYAVLIVSLNQMLRRIDKMTIIDALQSGTFSAPHQKKERFIQRLKITFKTEDLAFILHQLRVQKRPWLQLAGIYCLITFTLLLPLNMFMTLTSPNFTRYVGAASSDVRIMIDNTLYNQPVLRAIEEQLEKDTTVETQHPFMTLKTQLDRPSGPMNFLVEVGQYTTFPIQMTEGRLPAAKGEIALSSLNLNRLEKKLGDPLTLTLLGKPEKLEIVGVYQDITNGGLTAKLSSAQFEKHQGASSLSQSADVVTITYFINLSENIDPNVFSKTWSSQFPEAKTIPVKTLIQQTLGSITNSLGLAVIALIGIATLMAVLMTVLFMTLRLRKQHAEDCVLMALGYTPKDLQVMYLIKSFIAIVAGVLLGAIGSITLGQGLVSGLLSLMQFGLTQMTFLIQPVIFLTFGFVWPLSMGLMVTWQMTRKLSRSNLLQFVNQ